MRLERTSPPQENVLRHWIHFPSAGKQLSIVDCYLLLFFLTRREEKRRMRTERRKKEGIKQDSRSTIKNWCLTERETRTRARTRTREKGRELEQQQPGRPVNKTKTSLSYTSLRSSVRKIRLSFISRICASSSARRSQRKKTNLGQDQ